MKRRDFIIRTALGLSAAQVSAPLVAGVKFSRNPFTLGVASGDVTQDSVVLWTRLAPEAAGSGRRYQPGRHTGALGIISGRSHATTHQAG